AAGFYDRVHVNLFTLRVLQTNFHRASDSNTHLKITLRSTPQRPQASPAQVINEKRATLYFYNP
ncbi:hypothetical protein, partial [Comamonas sp.]|uniref:hypothetical protein n=1 Tax=Comamonas sp. TaxID=34028 RepID=UPI002FCCAB0E